MANVGGYAGTLRRFPEAEPARWNPPDELSHMQRRMEDVFARTFGYTPLRTLIPSEPYIFEPNVEITETAAKFVFCIALPGFEIENVIVEAYEYSILIEGERKPVLTGEEVKAGAGWATSKASFRYEYPLPVAIDTKLVVATLKSGILTVKLPKIQPTTHKHVKINIHGS